MNEEMLQFQTYKNQLEEIKSHLSMIVEQKNQLQVAKEALEELTKTKKDSKILAPITQGIYIETKISNVEEVIVHSGAGVASKKNIKNTFESINEELKKLREYEKNIILQKNQLSTALIHMQREIMKKRGN